MVRLKDICDVDWGDTNLTKQSYVGNGMYLGVSAGGCDGRMDYYDFDANVPVISAIGANCGKMFLPDEPFVAIKNTITLNPHTNILGKYIYYALLNNHIPRRGGGQPFISKADTEEYLIYCPTLDEQQKIIDEFDKLENLISLRKQQLAKLDELVKSRFIEMFGDQRTNPFGWDMVTIGDIATEVRDGTSRPAVEGGKYPYLRMNNLTYEGYLDLTDLKYIDIPDNEIEKCVVRNGDVLFNRTNSV